MLISLYLTIFAILILFFIFFKFEIGLSIFILYSFVVPLYVLYFGGMTVGVNAIIFLILLLFILKKTGRPIIYKPLVPFFYLYGLQALIIPLHYATQEPLSYELNMLRVSLMGLIIPFVIINIQSWKNTTAKWLNLAVYISATAVVLYGLFLITRLGTNPYTESLDSVVPRDNVLNLDFALDEGIRIFGYISSLFYNVTELGVFLLAILPFLYLDYSHRERKKPIISVITGVVVLIAVCGSRSVLMAFIILIVVYCVLMRKFKIASGVAIAGVAVYYAILTFLPEYMTFIDSIQNADANGSSIEMRLNQFSGCLDAIKDNPIFGNGYSWTTWYRTEYGRHPVMLAFESIIIQVLCNNGLMGIIIWTIFIYTYWKFVKVHYGSDRDTYCAFLCLLYGYLAYTVFTGDYGGFNIVLIIYSIMIAKENSITKNCTNGK